MFPFNVWGPIVLPVVLGGHHRKLLPYDMNGPLKQVMMSLFRLAWSSKIRLPLLITVAFLALDVHLQMEINVFWEANHREIEVPDDDDIQRRRHVRTQQNRPILPPVAPLAVTEDLDDEENNTTTDTSSSSSSTIANDNHVSKCVNFQNYMIPITSDVVEVDLDEEVWGDEEELEIPLHVYSSHTSE